MRSASVSPSSSWSVLSGPAMRPSEQATISTFIAPEYARVDLIRTTTSQNCSAITLGQLSAAPVERLRSRCRAGRASSTYTSPVNHGMRGLTMTTNGGLVARGDAVMADLAAARDRLRTALEACATKHAAALLEALWWSLADAPAMGFEMMASARELTHVASAIVSDETWCGRIPSQVWRRPNSSRPGSRSPRGARTRSRGNRPCTISTPRATCSQSSSTAR